MMIVVVVMVTTVTLVCLPHKTRRDSRPVSSINFVISSQTSVAGTQALRPSIELKSQTNLVHFRKPLITRSRSRLLFPNKLIGCDVFRVVPLSGCHVFRVVPSLGCHVFRVVPSLGCHVFRVVPSLGCHVFRGFIGQSCP